MAVVLFLGTVETKREEMDYLAAALAGHGLAVRVLDLSLGADDTVLDGAAKLARMVEVVENTAASLRDDQADCLAALGLGGGTGGEMVLRVMRRLPTCLPKLLLTTLPFDPRADLADTAVTLIPTLCDIEGMNPMLRARFQTTAAMVAGLARVQAQNEGVGRPNIAVTTLGVTCAASASVRQALLGAGYDSTIFHANGYGGAAFARFLREGRADGVIDLNVHELGRMRLAGDHVPMPDRFACAVPRVVLPGGLNFLGLGPVESLPHPYQSRAMARHSSHFTHVALTDEEMQTLATALAVQLNRSNVPCHVILPMGGFSSHDAPGGALENPVLRQIAAEVLDKQARAYTTARLPDHINSAATAQAAVAALFERMTHA